VDVEPTSSSNRHAVFLLDNARGGTEMPKALRVERVENRAGYFNSPETMAHAPGPLEAVAKDGRVFLQCPRVLVPPIALVAVTGSEADQAVNARAETDPREIGFEFAENVGDHARADVGFRDEKSRLREVERGCERVSE